MSKRARQLALTKLSSLYRMISCITLNLTALYGWFHLLMRERSFSIRLMEVYLELINYVKRKSIVSSILTIGGLVCEVWRQPMVLWLFNMCHTQYRTCDTSTTHPNTSYRAIRQFPCSSDGNKIYAVVFMDYLTKWSEVFATSDQTAELLVEQIITRVFSLRSCLIELEDLYQGWWRKYREVDGFPWSKHNGLSPQTNELVEQFNRTLTAMLAKTMEKGGKDWDQCLPLHIEPVNRIQQWNLLSSCCMGAIQDCQPWLSYCLLQVEVTWIWTRTGYKDVFSLGVSQKVCTKTQKKYFDTRQEGQANPISDWRQSTYFS